VTASRSDAGRLCRTPWGAALLLVALCACAGRGGMPVDPGLQPLPSARALVPDDADLAARDLAAAAFAKNQPGVSSALSRLEGLDAEQTQMDGRPTGLVPVATDLAAASTDDHAAYVRHADALLERNDLDPALRTRLEQTLADEPLRLAAQRRRDAFLNEVAGIFNVLAQPLGKAAMNGISAAAGVGQALLGLAITKHLEDGVSTPERQALVQERRFLKESPDSPEAPDVAARVEEDQARLARMQRDKSLRTGRRALQVGNARVALLAAERALRFVPEDADATEMRDEAAQRLKAERSDRERPLEVSTEKGHDPAPPAAQPLTVALLDPHGDVAGEARKLLDRDPEGPLSDEARYARAIALGESHRETEMWAELADLSKGEDDADGPNMAREAGLLITSPDSNPYGAYLAARSSERSARVGWLLLGPLANGPRDRDLPRPVEWLIEVPALVQIVTSLPNRIIRYPWLDPNTFGRKPQQAARAYLAREPDGEYAPAVREFLIETESDAGNYAAAYDLIKEGETDPDTVAELQEKASRQVFDLAKKEKRRDLRILLAQRAAQQFPNTEAGNEAGHFVREEVGKATPQQVRITRNFLRENPNVAGPDGLGIQTAYLDGSLRNGELHPDGVVLAGGQLLELRFVAESGKEEDPPAVARRQISSERLARTVSLLEETARRNELLDSDNDQQPDARRDLFFEQARLGLASSPDLRPSAESEYVFKGLRDKYGLVRGRESILPVDIVLQGSLPDIGLGAFPRIHTAKPTPDAILYK
jgi:hypothetical protein